MTKKPRDRRKREATRKFNSVAKARITVVVAIGGVHHDRVAFVETETVNQSQTGRG